MGKASGEFRVSSRLGFGFGIAGVSGFESAALGTRRCGEGAELIYLALDSRGIEISGPGKCRRLRDATKIPARMGDML